MVTSHTITIDCAVALQGECKLHKTLWVVMVETHRARIPICWLRKSSWTKPTMEIMHHAGSRSAWKLCRCLLIRPPHSLSHTRVHTHTHTHTQRERERERHTHTHTYTYTHTHATVTRGCAGLSMGCQTTHTHTHTHTHTLSQLGRVAVQGCPWVVKLHVP
jgi:hypothetical protein